jgi:hypothetical protein
MALLGTVWSIASFLSARGCFFEMRPTGRLDNQTLMPMERGES